LWWDVEQATPDPAIVLTPLFHGRRMAGTVKRGFFHPTQRTQENTQQTQLTERP